MTDTVTPDESLATAGGTEPEPSPEVELAEPDAPLETAQPDPPQAAWVEDRPDAPRRSGFGGLLLGGALAAGLGAAAAAYVLPKFWAPKADPGLSAVNEELARESVRIDALAGEIENLGKRPVPSADDLATLEGTLAGELENLRQSLAATDNRIAGNAKTIDALDARLATLEKRPVAGGEASATALEAFGREMEVMRAEIEAQRQAADDARAEIAAAADAVTERLAAAEAEAERLRSEAETAASKANARADMSRILAAMDTGVAFGASLAGLRDAGIEIPPQLAEQAQGVPTLAALRQSFPPAARDALAASLKETSTEGGWSRMTAFLRSQTGARSLSPRAGDDPDAVLSRAEAALGAGDVATALNELEGLPQGGQARMAEWVKRATQRLAAERAVAELKTVLE
ncbi:MAG: hypothetical protein R3E44_01660 [Paracoccaceae bacterium]